MESLIDAPLEAVWAATQDPGQHQRWDVRFGEISYQPRFEGGPQRFTYATTLLPGFTITGTGESLGDRDRPDGRHWSGLKFWADDWRSIIEAGAGYWRYVPTENGIRFLTRYDYRPRWDRLGEVIDRHAVRPIFGWATAWSFDRLRLWMEQGIPPERSRNRTIAHGGAVYGLAGMWMYDGLLRKRLSGAGAAEVVAGLLTVRASRRKWPFLTTAVAVPLLVFSADRAHRRSFRRVLTPAWMGWVTATLAAVAVATADDLPSAQRPLRTAPDRQPNVGDLP